MDFDIYRVKGGDKHMNEISQLSVVCTHITHDASGKAKETKRRFTNLNTKATDSEIDHSSISLHI